MLSHLRIALQRAAAVLAILSPLTGPVLAAQDVGATVSAVGTSAGASAGDYQRARYHPLHFKPAIDRATDAQCLACHAEVLKPSVRAASPVGQTSAEAKAWYQVTSTYAGEQDTFHRRHLSTAMAKDLMRLQCTTCHQGNDVRDETPLSSATAQRSGGFNLRKMVVTETTCLKCHGQMNHTVMGLPDKWPKVRDTFQNNCLLCHASIRTTRHQVNYLNAEAIEKAGALSGDACFGCHGGRAWYRLNYPYPRHAWEGMAPEVPDWAQGRPTESEPRFRLDVKNEPAKGQP